ncbi:hypothetical protein CRYUN_Cryun29cG0045100 [Craigia yunnanensis]
MGEPIVAASNKEVKTGEMASSNPALEVSVSFGRFENDSLSWEKWSSFSPNKYSEEVEKCATPGSVAKKKVYFEEHYKKIAARKAELQAQQKPTETVLVKQVVETLSKGSQDVKDLSQNSEKDIENTPKIKDKNVKLGHSAKSHKRALKPTSTPTTSSASRTPSKTGTTSSYSLPKAKNSVGESKKVAPRSLHMSLSLGPSGSGPASLAAKRKSLIVEKMGDKDIIK